MFTSPGPHLRISWSTKIWSLCSLQFVLDIGEGEFQQTSPSLMEVSKNLWATCNTDFGRIKSAEPLKIQTDITKPLPKLPDIHSSLSPHRPRPTADDLTTQGYSVLLPAPQHTSQASPETSCVGWPFVQGLRAVTKHLFPTSRCVQTQTLFCH